MNETLWLAEKGDWDRSQLYQSQLKALAGNGHRVLLCPLNVNLAKEHLSRGYHSLV